MFKLLLALTVAHAAFSARLPEAVKNPSTSAGLADKIGNIPEIKQILQSHLRSDPGFQAAVKRLRSEEFKKKLKALHDNAEWQKLKSHLKDAGFDLQPFIDHALHCLNGSDVSKVADTVKPDLGPLFGDMHNLTIPVLKAISPDMPMLEKIVEKLMDPKVKGLWEAAVKTPEMVAVLDELRGMKVPVDAALKFVGNFLGWDEKTKPAA